jgi:hypothetical protein
MKEQIRLIKIWATFIAFILLFLINFEVKTNMGYTTTMWLILEVCILILSILMLIKNRMPKRNQILNH